MQAAIGITLSRLAWTSALLPFVTVHVSYLLAAAYGHVDWCVPYWDSCTSISATGRELPEKLWFKLGMMPAALCTALLWWALAGWFSSQVTNRPRLLGALVWLGWLAAIFLSLYTAALGEIGDIYQRTRRTGIILTFSFTFLAQLLATHLLYELAKKHGDDFLGLWHRRLLGLMILLLITGLVSVLLDALLGPAYDRIEDAFEWWLALMLNAWFIGLAVVLGRSKVAVVIR